jgi:hypothetical protein
MPVPHVITHTFQGKSGLSEDRFVNTFHALSDEPLLPANFTALVTAIQHFYHPAASNGLSSYLSQELNTIGRTIKVYDLTQAKPRAPIFTFVDTAVPFAVIAGDTMPAEVACCLSYEAVKLSGTPQARRRGRLYLGPFSVLAIDNTDANLKSRPKQGMIDIATLAADALRIAMSAAGFEWSVYSPTIDAGDVGDPAAFVPIDHWWMDNAWDTQRRRGAAPTNRTVKVATP